MGSFTDLGVGGIIVILVLKEVFTFLKFKKNGWQEQISDLHKWHNQRDRDGVPVWYVRHSLEDSINRLSKNIAIQNDLLKELVNANRPK